MPLGDSITWGAGSTNTQSYRAPLFHLSLMNNKKLTFVGSAQDGPDTVDGVPFPKHHEGHSGWTIDDGGGRMGLYPQIQMWLTNTPPDIVTLMIGTNDVDISLDLANAPMRLGLLLDRISMYAPNALIVVAQIVPTTDDTENVRTMAYNGAIPGLVKDRVDAGKHVISVDMYGAFMKNPDFKTAYMNDKLHPKDPGYAVMADTWWAAIGDLLPAK
jgi:lysophospholipase L1-like esterase